MHIRLISTTVKLSYRKHAYNKFTLIVSEVNFILLILKLYTSNKLMIICHKLLLSLRYHLSLALCCDQVLLYKTHMYWLLWGGGILTVWQVLDDVEEAQQQILHLHDVQLLVLHQDLWRLRGTGDVRGWILDVLIGRSSEI